MPPRVFAGPSFSGCHCIHVPLSDGYIILNSPGIHKQIFAILKDFYENYNNFSRQFYVSRIFFACF